MENIGVHNSACGPRSCPELDPLETALVTQLRGSGNNGLAALGAAIVSVLSFGQALGQFVFYYADLETNLGAIAQIREYMSEIVPEDGAGINTEEVLEGWPARGEVIFERMCAAYGAHDEDMLRDVSLEIPAR